MSRIIALVLAASLSNTANAQEAVQILKPAEGVVALAGVGETIFVDENYSYTEGEFIESDAAMSKGWFGWRATIPARTPLNVVPHKSKIKACTSEEAAYSTIRVDVRALACAFDDDKDGKFDRISVAGGSGGDIAPTAYRKVRLRTIVDGSGYKRQLRFTGLVSGKASFELDEYLSDLSKPTRTSPIEIDISNLPSAQRIGGRTVRFLKFENGSLHYRIEG